MPPFRAALAFAALVLSFLGAPVAQAQASAANPGHLAVRGQDIVDPSGRPIVLRGWNWGHFGKAQPQDAADNVAQGANVVRLPIRWWGFYRGEGIDSRNDSAPGGIDPAVLRIVDDNIRWASSQHLWIVLFIDSDCGQNGLQPNDQDYCDPQHKYPNGHNFWTDPDARRRFLDLWRFIAARYKDTPYLGMFEPLPEPGNENVSNEQIAQFYAEAMGAIRQVAPGIPFLVGGNRYRAEQVRGVVNPQWKDVVYTGNLFMHENGKEPGMGNIRPRLQALAEARNRANVPVFVQQVGVKNGMDPDQALLKQLMAALNESRIGYTYWEYRGAGNPDAYGVIFEGSGKKKKMAAGVSGPQTNQAALSVISQSFRAR